MSENVHTLETRTCLVQVKPLYGGYAVTVLHRPTDEVRLYMTGLKDAERALSEGLFSASVADAAGER